MIKYFLSLLVILSPIHGWSLITHVIDTKYPLEVTFSQYHHNRIAYTGGKIKKVIAPQNYFSIQIEQDSGQVFVHALALPPRPVVISLVTDTGLVQDLSITVADQPPEVVMISLPQQKKMSAKEGYHGVHTRMTLESILSQLKQNKIPAGYTERKLVVTTHTMPPMQHLKAHMQRVLEGPYETITVYTLKNRGPVPLALAESLFKRDRATWTFLEQDLLVPGASTLLILSDAKEEG